MGEMMTVTVSWMRGRMKSLCGALVREPVVRGRSVVFWGSGEAVARRGLRRSVATA